MAAGVADDKGQLYLLLSAARELARAGELPVNVRFTCDGEEETGGNSILEFLAADDRGADAAVIFDTEMVARGVPAFNIATRGLVYFHLTLRSGGHDLHSGIYGGAAMNAAHALAHTLTAVTARDGRLAEPLRAGIQPPTQAELDGWRELPSGRRRAGGPGRAAGGRRAPPRSSTSARSPSPRSTSTASTPARRTCRRPCCRSRPTPTSRSDWRPARIRTPSPRRSSGSFATPRPTAPNWRSSGGRRPPRDSWTPTLVRSRSGSTRSSERSGCGRC